MFFRFLSNRVRTLAATGASRSRTPACGPEVLRDVLVRERCRADRTGLGFSLLCFTVGGAPPAGKQPLVSVAKHISTRSRCTDYLGWLDNDHFVFLMTGCSSASAHSLGTQVCNRFSEEDYRVQFEVRHYACRASSPNHSDGNANHPPGNSHTGPCIAPIAGDVSAREVLAESADGLFAHATPLWKRGLDVVGAFTGLILLSPILLLSAVAVKLGSRGPVIFQQQRVGRLGRAFTMYKFRTMVADAEKCQRELQRFNEQDGPAFKIENDPRVTGVGRVLRSFSVDELPQLWNVLRGDMSLVGPRPLPISEANACVGWQTQRTAVVPGLTCFWQVCDRRSKVPFEEWVRMDIRYIRSRTLIVDVLLILQTILCIVSRRGV